MVEESIDTRGRELYINELTENINETINKSQRLSIEKEKRKKKNKPKKKKELKTAANS